MSKCVRYFQVVIKFFHRSVRNTCRLSVLTVIPSLLIKSSTTKKRLNQNLLINQVHPKAGMAGFKGLIEKTEVISMPDVSILNLAEVLQAT